MQRDCPCGADRPYGACCEPFHLGAREAPDAEALMRSRYAAFALRRVEYLWRTLHPEHPDRKRPEAEVLAGLRAAVGSYRYQGLTVLDRAEPDKDGVAQVLFHARVFLKGRDQGFVECSDFADDGVGWRYLAGVACSPSALGVALPGLTIARFLALRGG